MPEGAQGFAVLRLRLPGELLLDLLDCEVLGSLGQGLRELVSKHPGAAFVHTLDAPVFPSV